MAGPLVDRPSLADRKKHEKRRRLEADEYLRTCIATPAGKAVLWRLITSVTGVFGPSFSTDPGISAFNEGKRAVGLALVRELQRVAPGAYLQMVQERTNAEMIELAFRASPEADEEAEDEAHGDSSTS